MPIARIVLVLHAHRLRADGNPQGIFALPAHQRADNIHQRIVESWLRLPGR